MASRLLLIAATLTVLAAGLAVWTAREALSTDQWVGTSSALARDPTIRDATAGYLAGQLPDVPGVDAATRDRIVRDVLASPAFAQEWRRSNRAAHRELVAAVDGRRAGPVVFDLRPMVVRIAGRYGLGAQADARIAPGVGRVTVVPAARVERVRTAARLLRGAAWVLAALAVVLLAASVAAARRGRRAAAAARAGAGVLVAGAGLLALRALAGPVVVDEVAPAGLGRPAAEAVWRIGTLSLQHVAWALMAAGAAAAVTAGALGLARARGPRTGRSPRTAPR
jgi:hypothetical protein